MFRKNLLSPSSVRKMAAFRSETKSVRNRLPQICVTAAAKNMFDVPVYDF
jgi:hypothetical protein